MSKADVASVSPSSEETSTFESLYGGQFTLSTQLIKPNYLVILPPTLHHSFFRNLPPPPPLHPTWFYSLFLVRRCDHLIAPLNGFIRGSGCYRIYSSVCEMECNEGYEPLGSTKRQCIVHPEYDVMVWSGNALNCAGQRA